MNTSVEIEATLAEEVSHDLHDSIYQELRKTIIKNIFS